MIEGLWPVQQLYATKPDTKEDHDCYWKTATKRSVLDGKGVTPSTVEDIARSAAAGDVLCAGLMSKFHMHTLR